ncbi:hypothetical protein A2U01_0007028, partial [Trifolium medium]|nr:hypothetical protein [Trifolium medium]
RCDEEEDGHSSGRVSSNSDAVGWQGVEEDLFSDGRSDSDKSVSYQLLLQVERESGLKSMGGAASVEVSDVKEGVDVADNPKHVPVEVFVGESVTEVQTATRHVEVEGERCLQFPTVLESRECMDVRGFEFVEGPMVCLTKKNDGDVSDLQEGDLDLASLKVGIDIGLENGGVINGGPNIVHWNPFVEVEANMEVGLQLGPAGGCCQEREGGVFPHPVGACEDQAGGGVVFDSCEVGARAQEGGCFNEDGGVHRLGVSSDVSTSSLGDSNVLKKRIKKCNRARKPHNISLPLIPPSEAPMFRKLALALKSAGKRRKVADPAILVPMCQASTSAAEVGVAPGIDVLPILGSGIDLLLDKEGDLAPDSFSATEEGRFRKEDEANVLMGIQKEVGFTFEVEESEIQSRGLGSRVKRRRVKDLILKEMVDFMAIQETKIEVLSDALVHSLWGGDDCEWVALPAEGNSGGILSIWRKTALGES